VGGWDHGFPSAGLALVCGLVVAVVAVHPKVQVHAASSYLNVVDLPLAVLLAPGHASSSAPWA
jgi:hypothetical protein